jgi:CxxC motif-containing protein (DUF1111 family)
MAPLTVLRLTLPLILVATAAADPRPVRGPSGTALRFERGLAEFTRVWTPREGLGPAFNAASCAACHRQPLTGGGSETATPSGRRGSLRQAPPLFGVGLIDAIQDRRIRRRADPDDRDHDGISGRANTVYGPRGRVARFGWKAREYSLYTFVPRAFSSEMGITSDVHPVDSRGEEDVDDGVADPEDDGAVYSVLQFVQLLAPLRSTAHARRLRPGRTLFRRIGCALCHVPRLRTDAPNGNALSAPNAVLGRVVPLFSDLLLHDLGPDLADGVEEEVASGSEFRTAPLWGVGSTAPYLHDGRAATLEDAIAAHGGEAADVRRRFFALAEAEQAALIEYLRAL